MCVGDTDTMLLLTSKFALLLVFGNERDRIETLIQCAEWSQFAVRYQT